MPKVITKKKHQIKKRQQQLLFFIAEDFIKTAIPVSSARVIQAGGFNCCSGTIRNDMMLLEKYQLIEKPHASAGRVPTAKGYRYYAKYSGKNMKYEHIESAIKEIFDNRATTIKAVIQQSCMLIAEVLKLPVAVFQSNISNKDDRIQAIQLFKINENKAMIVVISNEQVLVEKVIEIKDKKKFEELELCLAIISKRLFNSPFHEVLERLDELIPLLENHISNFENDLKRNILDIFRQAVMKVNVYGSINATSLPEFNDVKMLQNIMKILDKNNIWKLLSSEFYVNEKMGPKLNYIYNKEFSVISVTLEQNMTLVVVGPKRMDYPMIMAALESIKQNTMRRRSMIPYWGAKELEHEE